MKKKIKKQAVQFFKNATNAIFTQVLICRTEWVNPVDTTQKRDLVCDPTLDAVGQMHAYADRENIKIRTCLISEPPKFSIKEDEIAVPAGCVFASPGAYISAMFHELAHSTGYPSRLFRFSATRDNGEQYAFEEIVAEITAMAFTEYFGGADNFTRSNSIAYIADWLRHIPGGGLTTLAKAQKKAQEAFLFILNIN